MDRREQAFTAMNTVPATLTYERDANGSPVESAFDREALQRAFKLFAGRRLHGRQVYFAPPQHHMTILHAHLQGQGDLLEPLTDPNNTVLDDAPSLDELLGTELPDEG